MGLVDFVEALEVVLVRLGEGNNQQGCSDDHLGTALLELAARYLGCNKSKGNPHIGFLGKLGILSQPRGIPIFNKFFQNKICLAIVQKCDEIRRKKCA